MISSKQHQTFKTQIIELRKRVIELSKGKAQVQHLQQIQAKIFSSINLIEEYLNKISRDLQKIKCKEVSLQLLERGLQGKYQNEKTVLYLWQIINFLIIHQSNLGSWLLALATALLNASIRYEGCFSVNTIKNGLIAIHNIVASCIKTQQSYKQQCQQFIFRWLQAILAYYFGKQSSKKQQSVFKQQKNQQHLVGQMEWIAYIFKQLFSNTFYQSNNQSFIQQFWVCSHNKNVGYYMLHMIGNFFQDIIDKRVTTELVSGYQCSINDIKQMYSSKQKVLVAFKISKNDLKWICKILNNSTSKYNQLVKEYLNKQILREQLNVQEFHHRWREVSDMIQQSIHVLNCILFIGGYNRKLQEQIIQAVLEQSKQLLNYFEVSYLLYRNIEATKYKTKVSLIVEMEKEVKSKLFKLASIQNINIEQISIIEMRLDNILAKGQLVSLLRLMSNLAHINQRAQKPFEQDVKYLHMILSLTHDSISQATMKEWAIMFIKNVSQWSEKLRQQIANVKIQMKVQ